MADSSVAQEHDLADHAPAGEQLMRMFCFPQRQPARDQRLDLLLSKEVQQGNQILTEQFGLPSLERLNAVGDQTFSARQQPPCRNIGREGGGSAKPIPTPRTAGRQSISTDGGNQAITDDLSAG